MFKRVGYRIELLILFSIIALNVLDFFELLDPFWDYVKKIISWTLIGYLIYHASPMRIMLGKKHKFLDISYVLAAFAVNINDLISYAVTARGAMIAHASEYLTFMKDEAVKNASIIVTNISDKAWNTLTIWGLVPDASVHLAAHATEVTMMNPSVPMMFQYGSETITYSLYPQGLNGALLQIYNTIIPYMPEIQRWGLVFGLIVFALMTLWITLRIPLEKPSFVALLDREGPPHGLTGISARFIIVYLSFIFFFLFVFNLMMEWLAIAIDAPLLMIGVAISIVFFLRHKREYDAAKWIQEVAGFGINFFERFTALFHSKHYVLLGASGLLVLHVVTEMGNFLLPFAAPMRDQLYLSRLGPGHENLFVLAVQSFGTSFIQNAADVTVTALVIIAWAFLLGFPGYIWYKIFRLRHENHPRHHPNLRPWCLGLFFSSLVTALLVPLIWVKKLTQPGLVGVDFFTRSLEVARLDPLMVVLIAVAIFVLVFVLAQFSQIRVFLQLGPILASILFLGLYISLFFISSFSYYLSVALGAFVAGQIGVGIGFFLFLMLTVIFYVSGYFLFLFEIVRD